MAIESGIKNTAQQELEDQYVNIHVAVRNIEKLAALIKEIANNMKLNPEWATYPDEEQRKKVDDLVIYANSVQVDIYLKDKTKTPKDKGKSK